MKIHHIHIENVQGARAVDIDTPERVTMICGPNGAGKSSVADAIRLALTGAIDRVKLKRDLPLLVSDGSKSGRITLATDSGVREATVPKMGKAPADMHPMLPLVLKPSLIAQMDDKSLRTALFTLMAVKADRDAVAGRMVTRGCDPKRVAEVQAIMRSGFGAVVEYAKQRAAEARGGWKALAGETYGSSRAEGWKPEVPRFDVADLERAQKHLHDIENRSNAQAEDIGRAEAGNKAIRDYAARMNQARELAAKIPRIEAKLKTDRDELARLEPIVRDLQASELSQKAQPCPCCGVLLVARNNQLIQAEPLASGTDDDLSRLPSYLQAIDTCRRAITNGERDLATAKAAKSDVDEYDNAEAKPGDADIERLRAELGQLREQRTEAAEVVARFMAAKRDSENAGDLAKRAAALHQDVLAWEKIAEAMQPDGIPGELLAEAIGPFNRRLAASSNAANWPTVMVTSDMAITYGGRPYALLSESEQWRTDAILGEAVALLSGLRILLLDRFDVLDLAGRADLIDWLVASGDDMDTVLLLGTLKAAPDLPGSMRSHWIDGGVVASKAEATT